MNAAHSIDAPAYLVTPAQQDDDSIIARALAILAARIKGGPLMTCSTLPGSRLRNASRLDCAPGRIAHP